MLSLIKKNTKQDKIMKQKEKNERKHTSVTYIDTTGYGKVPKKGQNLSLEEQLDGKSLQLKNTQTPQEGIMGR